MRRPTRAQLLRRRTVALAVAAVAVALLAGGVLGRGTNDDERRRIAGPSPTAPASPTTGAPASTTAPATTTPTGLFLPATLADGPVVGTGPLRTYRVEVEDGTGVEADIFAAEVERILSDPRGWTTADGVSLQRQQGQEAQIVVTLATPATVDFLCYPLDTSDGDVSCAKEGQAVINLERWLHGAEPSGLPLDGYREYLVSHEVGHVLGHRHEPCPGPGQLAPVMLQQTLGIGDCAPNPWPAPDSAAG